MGKEFNYENVAKGFTNMLKNWTDLIAQRNKLQIDVMDNTRKMKENFMWKIIEQNMERQNKLKFMQEAQQQFGNQEDEYGMSAPQMRVSASGEPTFHYESPSEKEKRIQDGYRQIRAMELSGKPLSESQAGAIRRFREKYPEEVWGGQGQGQFRLAEDVDIPEGYEIMGYDQKGNPMIRKIQPSALQKETAKTQAKIQQSKITSQYNLNLTTEATRDLSDWLVKGYREGGAGTRYGAAATKVAAGGWLPPKAASKFAASGAIVGKRNEVLMKMFPMLTQQIGKEGSVRLIESVISRIGQTLPDTHTPPALARTQLASTIQSLYRISRAIENLDLSQLNDKNISSFSELITQETMRMPIEQDEQAILDNLTDTALEPLDDYLGNRQQSQDISEEDIQYTLKLHPEYTKEDLLKKLRR